MVKKSLSKQLLTRFQEDCAIPHYESLNLMKRIANILSLYFAFNPVYAPLEAELRLVHFIIKVVIAETEPGRLLLRIGSDTRLPPCAN